MKIFARSLSVPSRRGCTAYVNIYYMTVKNVHHALTEKRLRYPTILFDWGDTVMRDHPEITIPMVEWETIEVVEGIADVLEYLHSTGRRIGLATSAAISDEGQIRGALARGGLDIYFSHIY